MARFTMPVEELATIIRLALSAAPTDDSAPDSIRSVRFTFGPGDKHMPHYQHRTFKEVAVTDVALSAAATDRYRMVWATAPAEPTPSTDAAEALDFAVPAMMLRRWVTWAPKRKSSRAVPPKAVVEVTDHVVIITVGEDGWEQATTLPRTDAGRDRPSVPNLRNVVTYDTVEQPDHWAINAVYGAQMLTALSKVCKWREPVAVSSGGANKPVRFSTVGSGVQASGLVMIVKDL